MQSSALHQHFDVRACNTCVQHKTAHHQPRLYVHNLDHPNVNTQKMLEQPQSPPPRTPPPITQSQEFKFSSEERVKLHKQIIDPARRSRMSEAEREKLVRDEGVVTNSAIM